MGDTTGTCAFYETKRTVSQKKLEEAMALRERLEKWKEEKRKNRNFQHERLITKEPIHQIKNKSIRSAANGTPGARTTGSGPFNKRRSVAAELASQVDEKGFRLSGKPPLLKQSNTSGAKKGLARIARRTSNKENSVPHTEDLLGEFDVATKLGVHRDESEKFQDNAAEEEKKAVRNDKEQGALMDTPLSVPRSRELHEHIRTVNHVLKISSPGLSTPTAKKRRLTTYHPPSDLVACFPENSVERETLKLYGVSPSVAECPPAVQPTSNGQNTLSTGLYVESEGASQPEDTLCKTAKSTESSETVKPCNSQSSVLQTKAAVTTAAKLGSSKQARFSLSAQFLKPRRRSLPAAAAAAKSHVIPPAKSQSRQSLQAPKFCLQKSSAEKMVSKSILKRRSCFGGKVNLVAGNASPASIESRKQGSNPEDRQGDGLQTPGWRDGQQLVTKGSTNHVTFASNVETKEESLAFRKTPLIVRRDRRSVDPVRHRLHDWMASKSGTVKMRHVSCFSCQIPREKHVLRLQLKPSMTVKQLSEQENTLVEEELRRNLFKKFESQGSSDFRMLKPSTHAGSWVHADPSSGVRPKVNIEEPWRQSDSVDAGKVQERQLDRGAAGEQVANMMAAQGNDTSHRESIQLAGADESGELSRATDNIGLNRLDIDFDKCLDAVEEGLLSKTDALEWLDAVADSLEEVKNCPKWYGCKVAVLKISGETDRVLETFEQAIINDVQPREELASLLTKTMKELLSSQSRPRKGRTSVAGPGSASKRRMTSHCVPLQEVQPENMFESTTVKYSVVEVTPFKKRRRLTEVNERLVPVITPVRRSARLMAVQSKAASEGRIQGPGKRTLYSALTEVPQEKKQQMLFQPNQALKPMLDEMDDSCFEQAEPATLSVEN